MLFFFVQLGGVSTCNVTDRISFVNSVAVVCRKGVLESFWFVNCWSNPEASFFRYVGCICWLFPKTAWCGNFSRTEWIPILHISDKLWIPTLVDRRLRFPVHRTSQLTFLISGRPRHVWILCAATLNHSGQVGDCGRHASRARWAASRQC